MQDFRELLEPLREQTDLFGTKYRTYKAFPVGKFHVSIQGSSTHYCEPRKTINPYEYTEMEVAIFEKEKWVNPK